MSTSYFEFTPGARWAISRIVENRSIYLIQDSRLDNPRDAETILRALDLPVTQSNLDYYFPFDENRERCPTFELLKLCVDIIPNGGKFSKTVDVGI